MNRTVRTLLVYGLAILLLAVMAQWWFDQFTGPEEVPLSEFITRVEEGDFEAVEILARSNQVNGRVTDSDLPPEAWDLIAAYPDGFEGDLTILLRRKACHSSPTTSHPA